VPRSKEHRELYPIRVSIETQTETRSYAISTSDADNLVLGHRFNAYEDDGTCHVFLITRRINASGNISCTRLSKV
jgi:hypothetical protein